MKGDFTRFVFDPERLYVQTLMQQGRVLLDADWNEQASLQRYHAESTAADVIGQSGVPRDGGGFLISVNPGATDLLISPGDMYVEGLRCENRAAQPVPLSTQPFLRVASGGLAGFERPTAAGRYLAYLEVWERHVSPLQDDRLLDPALGGVDTTTRVQVVWQVRLVPAAAGATCAQFGPGWTPDGAIGTGRMTADTNRTQVTTNPCVLPPTAGYRGLENQLYRVEVHRGGPRDSATFKWSAWNGSIATTVGASGQTLTAHDLGRDEVTGFSDGQWIEVLDERLEVATGRGVLLRIESIQPERREITIAAATPVPALDTSGPIIIRRWDNPRAASADGLPMSGTPTHLEAAVVVSFEAGTYVPGDYWYIPARAAVNSAGGHIEWPRPGGVSSALLPHGIRRRFAPLALVDFNVGGTFAFVADCRRIFPSLTTLTAADVSFDSTVCNFQNATSVQAALDQICRSLTGGGCTVVLRPGTDLQASVDTIGARQDALYCFAAGAFTLAQPLAIRGKGHVVLSGAGGGTNVSAPNSEVAIVVDDCLSVQVRNLTVQTGLAQAGPPAAHLSGALTVLDCPSVSVDNVGVRSAPAATRGAACISIRNAAAESDALRQADTQAEIAAAEAAEHQAVEVARATTASIRHCQLHMGRSQVGVLLANVGVSHVTDNLLRVIPPTPISTADLNNPNVRALLRRALVTNLRVTTTSAAVPNTNAVVPVGSLFVHFRTDPTLAPTPGNNAFLRLVAALPPGTRTPQQARALVFDLADQALGYRRTLPVPLFAPFATIVQRARDADQATAAQGIVVGGRMAGEIHIRGNTIDGVLQGIHVGLSHRAAQRSQPDEAGTINIDGNTILTRIGSTAVRARHGVFIGSCRSVVIERNHLDVDRVGGSTAPIEGIRVYGTIGRRLIVRENHLQRFTTGIVAAPFVLSADRIRRNQWLVSDNIAEGASVVVAVSAAVEQMENSIGRSVIRRPDNYA